MCVAGAPITFICGYLQSGIIRGLQTWLKNLLSLWLNVTRHTIFVGACGACYPSSMQLGHAHKNWRTTLFNMKFASAQTPGESMK